MWGDFSRIGGSAACTVPVRQVRYSFTRTHAAEGPVPSVMSRDLTSEFAALFGDRIQLSTRIEELRNSYRAARPFPHVVIDNLFAPQILDPVLEEMSGMAERQWMIVETKSQERIRRMSSGVELGRAGSQLVGLVHSAPFLYLVSEITGVWQLLPDPYLQGAGYAAMKPGDFFNVHSDRNVAYETGLHRRLAMIVFLNKAWDSRYHGQLELWNSEATRCEVSVEPVFNRTVIFEVAYPNYHGVPQPIDCPVDRSRQSFIVYYHTAAIDGKLDVTPHTSIFAPRFYRPRSASLKSAARDLTPPVLFRVAKKLVTLWRTAAGRNVP